MSNTENYIRELEIYTEKCRRLGIPYGERCRMSQALKRLYIQDLFPMSLGAVGTPILDVSNWKKIEFHRTYDDTLVKVVWSTIDYGILVNDKVSHMGILNREQLSAFCNEVDELNLNIPIEYLEVSKQ